MINPLASPKPQLHTILVHYDGRPNVYANLGFMLAHLALIPGRMALRVAYFVTGDFITSGLRLANEQWRLEKKLAGLEGKVLSDRRFTELKTQHVLLEGIKNIGKIVLSPLANIASFFLAVGMTTRLIPFWEGALLISKMEYALMRNFERFDISKSPLERKDYTDIQRRRIAFQLSESLSPCLFPYEIWKKHNLFALDLPYHRDTLRSLVLRISTQLDNESAYWEKELGESYESLRELFKKFRAKVDKISPFDGYEVNKKCGLIESVPQTVVDLRLSLKKLESELLAIEKKRFAGETPDLKNVKTTIECLITFQNQYL